TLALAAVLNSFVFDFILRMRMAGNNLNYFVLEDCRVPSLDAITRHEGLIDEIATLCLAHERFAPALLQMCGPGQRRNAHMGAPQFHGLPDSGDDGQYLKRRAAIDAVLTHIYGLERDDLHYILRECDRDQVGRGLPAKGFWRVDRHKHCAARLTVATLDAFDELNRQGLRDFLDCVSDRQNQSRGKPSDRLLSHRQAPLEVHAARIEAVGELGR
ncbi:MAG TPA: hypothetical protein V6C72_05175, partial [Chroococcales cyanobacterium]